MRPLTLSDLARNLLKLIERLTRRSHDAAATVPFKLASTLVRWLQMIHQGLSESSELFPELPETQLMITHLLCNLCSHPSAITELIDSDALKMLWTNGLSSLEALKVVLSVGRYTSMTMEQPLLNYLHENACASSLLLPYTASVPSTQDANATALAISCLVLAIERSLGQSPSLMKQFRSSRGYDGLKTALVLMTISLQSDDELGPCGRSPTPVSPVMAPGSSYTVHYNAPHYRQEWSARGYHEWSGEGSPGGTAYTQAKAGLGGAIAAADSLPPALQQALGDICALIYASPPPTPPTVPPAPSASPPPPPPASSPPPFADNKGVKTPSSSSPRHPSSASPGGMNRHEVRG
jgi:hypothetical protein